MCKYLYLFFREIHFGQEKSHTTYDRSSSSDSFDISGNFSYRVLLNIYIYMQIHIIYMFIGIREKERQGLVDTY